MLTLILGGARSGKSRFAQRLATSSKRVCYIATAERGGDDPEMAARISRHRADRPADWKTIEEPLKLAAAIEQASVASDAIIVDCLTIWLSNLLWRSGDAAETEARGQLQSIASMPGRCQVILVSNEVGSGIVPESAVARAFRDLQGFANQEAAALADEVVLVTAGLPHYLKKAGRQ